MSLVSYNRSQQHMRRQYSSIEQTITLINTCRTWHEPVALRRRRRRSSSRVADEAGAFAGSRCLVGVCWLPGAEVALQLNVADTVVVSPCRWGFCPDTGIYCRRHRPLRRMSAASAASSKFPRARRQAEMRNRCRHVRAELFPSALGSFAPLFNVR